MVRLLFTLLLLGTIFNLNAQSTLFNYQAVARTDQGEPLINQQISVKFTISRKVDNNVDIVFIEEQDVTTDEYGLFKLYIGEGVPQIAPLDAIDWQEGTYMLNVSWDDEGGNDYQSLGTEEILPVPYALHAATVEDKDDADADPQNELQTLEFVKEDEALLISEGNKVIIPVSPFEKVDDTISYNAEEEFNFFVFGNSDPNVYGIDSLSNVRMYFDQSRGAFRAGTSYPGNFYISVIEQYFPSFPPTYLWWNRDYRGLYSFGTGAATMARGFASFASGIGNISEGDYSLTHGVLNETRGDASVAMGHGNKSKSYCQTVFGIFANTEEADQTAEPGLWRGSDYLFVLGNGTTDEDRSNAWEVYKDGSTNIYGVITVKKDPQDNEKLELHDDRISILNKRDNTFVGYRTGGMNNVGRDNTFLGDEAGYNNYNGNENTFIGSNSGKNNANGAANVFIGMNAGLDNETGTDNVFVGVQSGKSNNGWNNTFIGVQSGEMNTTGDNNTFIGNQSGRYNNSGRNNTYVGNKAGLNNNRGSENVFLGHFAGENNVAGEGNVFIGSSAGGQELGSNKLYIHNNDAPSDEALIYGEFDSGILSINGKVGIGNYPPVFDLDVHGDASVGAGGDAEGISEVLGIAGKAGSWYLGVENEDAEAKNDFFLSKITKADGTLHIKRDGKVGIGTTGPSSDLHLEHGTSQSQDGFLLLNEGNNRKWWRFWVGNNSGDLFLHSKAGGNQPDNYVGRFFDDTGEYGIASDRRVKKSITKMSAVLPSVLSLQAYRYHYKRQSEEDEKCIGFIAQDIADYFPELVEYDQKSDTYLLKYDGFSVLAIQAIQEQQEQIKSLKEKVNDLDARVKQLEEHLK